MKLNQSFIQNENIKQGGFEKIKNIKSEFTHNQTEVQNDSDMMEIKTNDDVFNEMKLTNEIEVYGKKLKNNINKSYCSMNSIKSSKSISFNDSETNSVVDMKNLGRSMKFDANIGTLESLNSIDFKNEKSNLNDSCKYSQKNFNEFIVNVKKSKL